MAQCKQLAAITGIAAQHITSKALGRELLRVRLVFFELSLAPRNMLKLSMSFSKAMARQSPPKRDGSWASATLLTSSSFFRR
jgi:hypothetical protein